MEKESICEELENKAEAAEESEEAVEAKPAMTPYQPSQEEIDRHMLTHVPYRNWCPHCVRGKAKGGAHRKAHSSENEIPTISLDYMFMHESQMAEEERGMPILVTKDAASKKGTGMVSARVLPAKGVNRYAVSNLASEIAKLGHNEMVLKSDGEPAIIALKQAVKMERSERIVLEESPVKESRSNGVIENAIQQVQGQIRATKRLP